MRVPHVTPDHPKPSGADAGPGGCSVPAAQADIRLRELFRLWVREGHVHPLIHLVRRYRCGDRD
jgi:hypothetical protein